MAILFESVDMSFRSVAGPDTKPPGSAESDDLEGDEDERSQVDGCGFVVADVVGMGLLMALDELQRSILVQLREKPIVLNRTVAELDDVSVKHFSKM
ncbi:hypothetical protein HYQ46_002318 [Verticillium longisporum]|nr:hypothetical protein HYQ46_002318 [Verticillium longisporum]